MIGDISLLDSYVNFIGRHRGRKGPKEPIFLVAVPFAVLINASFTYSELNITIRIVAHVPVENPILGSSCGSRQRYDANARWRATKNWAS
ncbi:hypothetical protein M405DRAFT_828145, partial [Rhizopogon salebrosus TDB-379]